MTHNPFEGPRLKIGWSRKHIEVLERAIAAYAERVQYGFREVSEAGAEMIQLRFVFSESPPEDISLLIGDSIHNLRSALDLMICDVARVRNVSTEKLAFPFAANEASLGKEIRNRKLVRLGEDIVAMVKELKPYAGGNRALSAVHELDIIDKHRMVMPVFQAVPFDNFQAGNFSIFGTAHMSPGALIVIRRGTPFKCRRQGGVTAIFPDASPLPRAPVVETLKEVADLISGIVEKLAGHIGARAQAQP
jgi:hypothetical protein